MTMFPDDPPGAAPRGPQRRRRLAWLAALNPAARITPAEPHKELRFTRARQAGQCAAFAAAAFAACLAMALLAWGPWGPTGVPMLAPWWLALLPWPLLGAALWAMVWCATHAYLILSPVGVEIFPLFFPGRGLRVVLWSEIAGLRVVDGRLWLDFHGGGGVVLALAPLAPAARILLLEAMARRLGRPSAGGR
jgi:hypothetical protein